MGRAWAVLRLAAIMVSATLTKRLTQWETVPTMRCIPAHEGIGLCGDWHATNCYKLSETSCCLSGKTLYWRYRDIGPIRWCHAERGEKNATTESLFPPWLIHLRTNERVSFVARDCVRQRRCRARPGCHGRTVGPGH